MKKILIFGAGGHSRVVADIILKQGEYKIFGFIDNNVPIGTKIMGSKVLGNDSGLAQILKDNDIHEGVIAIGDNYLRKKVAEKILNYKSDFNFINCIHPYASIALDVKIGSGNVFMAGSIVNSSTKIGSHCIFNTNSSIDHDNNIENFVSLAPNSTTGGNVNIGDLTSIGMSANILENISVKSNCLIGANSLINKDTRSFSVYFGSPAKYIREINS